MSLPVSLFFASRDGQTQRIAERIAERLGEAGLGVTLTNLNERQPDAAEITAAGVIVVAAAIRYGKHLPPAEHLLQMHAARIPQDHLALISINLTARKPGKDTAKGSVYLRKWLRRHRLTPAIATAVAGKLDYPRYGWFDRMMIRLIMTLTKGPTDPTLTIEFTDWDKVDALANDIARLATD